MKQQRKKLKVWLMLSTGIAVLGLVGWLKQSDDIAGAEPQVKQTEIKVSKGTDSPRSSLRTIEPIENDGLIAKAKAFTLVKYGKFPTAGALKAQVELMLEKLTLPAGSTAITWKYVDADGKAVTPSSATTGFQFIYVEITETAGGRSIRVPIPVTITDANTEVLANKTAFQMVPINGFIILYHDEVAGNNPNELKEIIKNRGSIRTWNTETGEEAPYTVTTNITGNALGNFSAKFNLEGVSSAELEKKIRIFGVEYKAPYFTVKQGLTLDVGVNGANLFSKYYTVGNTQVTQANYATYQWVANKAGDPTVPANTFTGKEAGFQTGYIKMTDTQYSAVSRVFSIPITVTNNEISTFDNLVGLRASKDVTLLEKAEIKGKTTTEIRSYIQDKMKPTAWELNTGDSLAVTIAKIGDLNSDSPMGSYELTYDVSMKDGTTKSTTGNVILVIDKIFAGSLDGWESLPYGSTKGVLENPINNSKIGFDKRGMFSYNNAGAESGYTAKDGDGSSYTRLDKKVNVTPFLDGKMIYDPNQEADRFAHTGGIGHANAEKYMAETYYLKKGNQLKQILIDSNNQLLYVYDLALNRNLNFSIYLSTYNLAQKVRQLGMLEAADVYYYDDNNPIYSLGKNQGFYIGYYSKRFNLRLADANGKWLSDYKRFVVGGWINAPSGPDFLAGINYFGRTFWREGFENRNVALGYKYVGGFDTAYQIAAPSTNIQPEEALRTGYEMSVGQAIPYMQIKANPEVINVYSDYSGETFDTNYTLSKIPVAGNIGTVYINYPNKEEVTVPFVADTNKEFKSSLSIPRRTLPDVLNDGTASVKSYETSLFAINESAGLMKNLPSEDYAVTISAYHFGATPVAQSIKQGTVWNKTAASLLKDSVIIPGHTATYEYVEEKPVDTSKLGLQYAKVRYTDQQDSTKSIVYDVPVNVIAGTVPTTGLTVAGNNFSISKGALEGLTKEAIDELILEKSKAIAWDNATGSQSDISLAVTTTTLTAEAEASKAYTATIRGTKEAATKDTTITINVEAGLEAEAVPQSVTLGSGASYWTSAKLHDTVKNVIKGNESISDYTVTLVKGPITDRLTETKMTVKLVETASPKVAVEIEVPVTVTWGDSLAIGGSETVLGSPSKQSTMAITLHQDDQPFVTTTYGNLPVGSETKPLSGSIGNQPYYQLTHVDLSKEVAGKDNAKELTAGPNSLGEVSLQALGTSTPAQMVGQLGTGGKLNVSYGDVLRLYTVEGFALYTKGEGPTQLTGLPNQTSFVVVTKNGLVPLYLNQLKSKEVTIDSESTATKERYEAHYNNLEHYLSLPEGANPIHFVGILPNGFKTYPKFDLAVGEKAQGSVYVAEPTGTSNVYLKFAYTMTFVGSGPELQIVGPLANLNFGTPTIKSHTQEIKRTNPNWSFTVLDSRMKKDAWVIQAKVANPFKTAGGKELRGAGLLIKESKNTRLLNGSFQTIYTKDTPTPSNQVTWSEAEGFFLQVPSGFIEKGADYQTELDILLTNAPTGKD